MTANHHGWLFEDAPSLVLVLDEALVCQNMAGAWRNRLDKKVAQSKALSAKDLFDFDSDPELSERFSAVISKGEPIVNAAIGLKLSAGILPCRIGAWRARQHDDDQPCVVVTATDVSLYRDAMEQLEALQTQQSLILDAAGEGIYGLDCDGSITFGNAAANSIVGWAAVDVIGQRAHDVHHHSYADGSSYPREDCPIYAALKDGEVHCVDDEVFWHANGNPVPVEYTSTPIMKNGRPDGAVVVFRDISARKELEQQREAAFDEIKELKDQLEQERDYLRDEINVAANFGEIIGESEALRRALAQIEAVADTPVSVLILGESGVGKEMIARAIHNKSNRCSMPLVKVNCASIPKDLFESEFFGHVRGAFTGAHQDRVGRLQLAAGGTLFLDEIGEIPMSQQGKLLRALQEGEFERVGDDQTISVDVRVVAATNRNLMDEIKAGRFREDLYYRLSVFPLDVPPLRDRLEDIAPLALHFLESICCELGRDTMRITQTQLASLRKHEWPGNIRELKNVIERAVISSPGNRLRLDLAVPGMATTLDAEQALTTADADGFLTVAELKEFEKANLKAALENANWKTWGPGGAAELLGMKPSTLAYQMKSFGIEKKRSGA
ncbi:MAG: sigma 54-interacting transcriptional regulator [Woeseiaceae bacterium]